VTEISFFPKEKDLKGAKKEEGRVKRSESKIEEEDNVRED